MILEVLTEAISELFFWTCEMLAAVLVYSLPLKRRNRYPLRLMAVLFGAVLVSVPVGYFIWNAFYSDTVTEAFAVPASLSFCLFLFLLAALLVWVCYDVPPREAVYCAACAYLMEHISYCILNLLNVPLGTLTDYGQPVYFLVYLLVYFTVFRIFSRRMVENGHYVTSAVDSALLTISVMAVVAVMSSLASLYGFVTLHSVYALFCCLYVLYGQLKNQKQLMLQSRLTAERELWKQRKAQYELSRETIDIINRKCHDLRHQVAALRQISDSSRKSQAIDAIEQSVMIYDALVDTGNDILDTVLTEKSLLCRRSGIELTCGLDGTLLAFLDPVDLYTLFGNAIDNAIEALEKLPEERRFLRISALKRAGLLLVQFENPYEGNLTLTDGLPSTSKTQEPGYHGFGLGSIQAIAEQYHGTMRLETDGGVFRLCLTFDLSAL